MESAWKGKGDGHHAPGVPLYEIYFVRKCKTINLHEDVDFFLSDVLSAHGRCEREHGNEWESMV